MTVLIDTGVLYAHHDEDARRHEAGRAAMDAVIRGAFGQPCVSDYIYEEVVTLTRSRATRFEPAREIGRRVRGVDGHPGLLEMIHIGPSPFDESVELFERYDDQALSFTDATTVTIADHHGIDSVLSFDDDFDGLTVRTNQQRWQSRTVTEDPPIP